MTTNQSNLLKFFGENKENQQPTTSENVDKANSTKKLSVERIYQKKTQLEHILLRPDSYIGSVEPTTQAMWVYDGSEVGMVYREITFVPGLYKIFDEILVNAADNKQRDKNMDCIKVEIEPSTNKISIWNNGKGIPVVEHKDEKMFVPSLIFGQLLTSSNYNDEEMKVTGGRNGYGAKLCNVFSTKFTIETFSSEDGKLFKQTWTNNMTKANNANIRAYQGTEFTCVTFYPDLAKFKMDVLDKDIVALMSRRVFDIAGSTKGVKVLLNGKKIPVKGFKDYIEQYTKTKQDDEGNPLKVIYENVNEHWEVGVTVSERGFQQMSFVNSIATTKGGRHVDYVAEQIINKLVEAVKKKNKRDVQVKPFQIKNHMWLFVNCLIVNPTFDSQTKENMTLQVKKFGSKCQLGDKFFTQLLKCGIMESILSWINVKAQTQLNQKCSGKKHSKIQGIPKLEDANNAGTSRSTNCTLILTEGDSAKTLAVSGLSIVGRDDFGVFPLKGKMLNVREATHKQILENQEINNIIKIMGLQYKKKYESMDDIKTLRYGHIMIMTDQDQDGSHIKGLLINFIHHNWPTLLRLPFLEEFITPIVKIFKGNQEKSFYSLPEYEEWKKETPSWNAWKIKYYKGLGTSTAKEAKEYFSDMNRHRIKFRYNDIEDDNAIQLAFSKKMVDERKEWLTAGMEERKRRRELGLPELYLYGKQTTNITYNDFINKELILFSNMDNERSIPSVVDGLKPGQRKVMYTCFKRNDKREIKVAQLAGSVAEHSAYHHGETSLMGTIINLAQNFVGSNNINLLQPIGQFGTRLQGGKDAASPRYIFTMLSPLSRKLFSQLDEAILTYLYDDNQRIEPEYYIPILPVVLINGAEGIGTGWSTKIPNYNPREIVENIRRMLRGEEPLTMNPWFKNFKGTIERIDDQHFIINGEISILGPSKLEITELPVRTWTQTYKEQVLETMLHGSEKSPALITDYKEYHTDTDVHFVVIMSEEKLSKLKEQGLHKAFKLQTTISTSAMVLFNHNGCIQKYSSPEDILKEFYTVRLKYYEHRKIFLEGMLAAEAKKLDNQARFILEKIEGKIIIEDQKKAELIKTLQKRGYESDPVKVWKKFHSKGQDTEELEEGKDESTDDSTPDYHYLLGMNLLSLTMEEKDELLKKRDEKFKELDAMKQKTPSDLWEDDLQAFMEELHATEEKERNEICGKTSKTGKTKKVLLCEVKPAYRGERVDPVIDPELKKKYEKLKGEEKKPRAKKTTKRQSNQKSDSDKIGMLKPLNERINNGKEAKNGLKQITLSFSAVKPYSKPAAAGKGPTSLQSSDVDVDISDSSDLEALTEELYNGEVKECGETSGKTLQTDETKKLMSSEVKPSFPQVPKYETVKCEEKKPRAKKVVKSKPNKKNDNHKMGKIKPLSKGFSNPKDGLKQTTLSFTAAKQGGTSAVSVVEKCPTNIQSLDLNVDISGSSDLQAAFKPSQRKKQKLDFSESAFSSSNDVKTSAADKDMHQTLLEDKIFSSTVAQSTSKQKGMLSELCYYKDTVHEKKGPKPKQMGKSSKDKPLKVKPVFDAFLKKNCETSDGHGGVNGAYSSAALNSADSLDFKKTALGSDSSEDSDSSIEVLIRKTRAKQIRKGYKDDSDSDAESTRKLAVKRTKESVETDPDFSTGRKYNVATANKGTSRKRIVISSSEDSD